MVGLSISRIGIGLGGSLSRVFNLSALFKDGEKGFIFDPSVADSLYQTTAILTQSAPGDPVGWIRDLSGNGNHATQATAAKRPTYGIHPKGGVRNLLTYTEDFSNAAWNKTGTTPTAQGDGITRLQGAGSTAVNYQAINVTAGQQRTFSFKAKNNGGTVAGLRIRDATNSADIVAHATDYLARINGITYSTVTTTYTVPAGCTTVWVYTNSITGTGTGFDILIKDVQDELGAAPTAYQKAVSQYNVTEITYTEKRNLLTYTEDFSNAVWTTTAATGFVGKFNKTGSTGFITQSVAFPTGPAFISVRAKVQDLRYLTIRTVSGFSVDSFHYFDLQDGLALSGNYPMDIVDEGEGVFRCKVAATATSSTVGFRIGACDLPSTAGSGVGETLLQGAQLAVTDSPYQKIDAAFVRSIANNVPSVHYLSFDGVDDAMVTPSINFTATDKMSIFAGVRKLSDSLGMLAELGAGGGLSMFYFLAGEDSASRYSSLANGTASQAVSQICKIVATGYAPDTAVITATHDIAGDLSVFRRNGVAGVDGTGDKGTGNFRNDVMNIGSRNTTTLFFKGNLYALTVRGKATDAATITKAEKNTAAKTGITL